MMFMMKIIPKIFYYNDVRVTQNRLRLVKDTIHQLMYELHNEENIPSMYDLNLSMLNYRQGYTTRKNSEMEPMSKFCEPASHMYKIPWNTLVIIILSSCHHIILSSYHHHTKFFELACDTSKIPLNTYHNITITNHKRISLITS